jgi:hypothetical protein
MDFNLEELRREGDAGAKEMQLTRWPTGAVCAALLLASASPRIAGQTSSQPDSPPILKISPAALTFPEQGVGTSGEAQTIMLTNTGKSDLQVTDILVSGIDFAQTNTCGTTLAAGASCDATVSFKPATLGPRLGTISIVTSDPGSPRLLPLTGAGK